MRSFFVYENKYYKKIDGITNYKITYAGGWCFEDYLNGQDNCVQDFWNSQAVLQRDIAYVQQLVEKVVVAAYDKLKHRFSAPIDLAGFRQTYYSWSVYTIFKLYGNWKILEECPPGFASYTFDIDYKQVLSETVSACNLIYFFSEWNSFVFSEMLKFRNVETVEIAWESEKKTTIKESIKKTIAHLYQRVSFLRKFVLNKTFEKEVFYFFTRNVDLMPSLQKNGSDTSYVQFIYSRFTRAIRAVAVDDKLRNEERLSFDFENDFERFISQVYFKLLPVSLLEGIPVLERFNLKFFYKSKQTAVVYSDFLNNEVLLFYLKEFDQNNIFVYQHGGGFGINDVTLTEAIEKTYSPHYLTWGWKRDKTDIPFFAPEIDIKNNGLRRKDICIVLYDSPPFIPVFQPTIYSRKFGEYLNSIRNLINESIHKADIVLRLYPRNDSGVDFYTYFSDSVSYNTSKRIEEFYSKYRLYVYTYNSTGFLELWRLNIPCVLFIDADNLFLDRVSTELYQPLLDSHLLFTDYRSFNSFINDKFPNIEEWWSGEQVQGTIKTFLDIYYNTDYNRSGLSGKTKNKAEQNSLTAVFNV